MGKSWNVKSSVDKSELCKILRDLADSIELGKVVLEKEDSFVSFEPSNDLTLKVEAEQKKDREKFSLDVTWYKPIKKQKLLLKISSTEPQVQEIMEEVTKTQENEE